MRKTLFFLFALCAMYVSAQVTTDPSIIYGDHTGQVVIKFDPTQGNAGMVDAEHCFAHTGLITSASKDTKDWKHVKSDWRALNTPELTWNAEVGVWELVISDIYTFYGASKDEVIYDLAFVFHDGLGGSKEGKTALGGDILVPVNEIINHTYTVNLYTPSTCPDMKPAILGMFNNWSENIPMTEKYDEYERLYYSYTFEDREGHEIKFREVNDHSKNWDNQIWHANFSTDEWEETPNILLGSDEEFTVDYSDNSLYMYGLCRQTFMPTNAKAVQKGSKVTFSWDLPESTAPYMYLYWYDEKAEQIYGSYQLSSGQTSYTVSFANAEDINMRWGFHAFTDNWFTIKYQDADPFVLKPSPYIPHDLMAIPEGDGSYTLSWMMDETEEVSYYGIWLSRIDGGYNVSYSVRDIMQCKTDILGLSGKYAYEVRVRDANGYTMGVGYDTIEVKPVEERDLLVRVLLQPGVDEIAATRFVDESNSMEAFALEAEKDNKGWYRATLRSTHPALPINLSFNYYSNRFQVSKDTCFEASYSYGLQPVNCDAKRQDYSPKNLKVVSVEDGRAELEWEWGEDVPYGYLLSMFHEDSTGWWYMWDYNNARTSASVAMPAEEPSKVLWSVTPYVNGMRLTEFQTYGDPFMVEPSTSSAHNLKATPNADGTYTLSWDKIKSDAVSYWYVRLTQPNGSDNYYYYEDLDITTYITSPLATLGTYTFYIYTYDENGKCIGASYCNFEVKLVPEHDIVVKLLVHPDVPMGVPTCKYDSIDGTTAYVTPKELGDYWYSYTIHTDKPVQYVTFGSRGLYLAKDTCIEYAPDGNLNQIACDAKAHDYRILEESLKATVYAGRVVFEWAAKDESDTYSLGLYDSETGEQVSGSEFNASKSKTYEMAIVDALDGKQVYWAVAPSSPYYLSYVSNDQKLTLKKSGVELTELKADTKDNKSFAFSWKSNTDTVQYLISISSIDYSKAIILDTIKANSCNYTFSIDGHYSWMIRPLTKKGEVMGQWVQGSDIEAKGNEPALANLTGKVVENQMVFEWEGAAPYFAVYQYYRAKGASYFEYLYGDVTQDHTTSITLDGDGDYAVVVYPMLTHAERLDDFLQLVVPYFAPSETPMCHVSITAEEGGQLGIEYVGDYPQGFVFDVYVYSVNAQYKFIGWSDGVASSSRSITLRCDTTITAKFVKKELYTVTVKAGEGGKVRIGTNDPATETYIVLAEGMATTLSAQSNPGYSFYQWSNRRTDAEISVYPNSDTTLTAEFKKFCYVKLSATEGGSAKLLNAKDFDYDEETGKYILHYGDEINVKAVPAEGYRFVKWSDNDENVNRTITVTADLNLQAQFEKVEKPLAKYTVRLLSNNTNLGTVNSQVNGTYFEGDKVTVIATPYANANFVKWSDGVAETTRTITVSQDTTLTAQFEVKTFHVSIKAGEHGSLSDEVDGTYEYGAYIYVYAIADEHYHFASWSDDVAESARNIYVYEDIDLTASFAIDQFLITFLDEDGSFLESNLWDYGSTPSCSFTPIKPEDEKSWYSFKGWNPEIVPVTEAKRYYAVYEVHDKPEGLDAVQEAEPARKIYRDGQIYILRGEKIYTVQGQVVK